MFVYMFVCVGMHSSNEGLCKHLYNTFPTAPKSFCYKKGLEGMVK